jgi:hypothetical protein
MTRKERLLRELCIEIVAGRIGSKRFNELLLETGIQLDEQEWDAANRLLGRSSPLMKLIDDPPSTC